jgi:hypothetical protein
MSLNLGLLFQAALLALGAYWCVHMYGRWWEDWQFLRESSDNVGRAVTIGIWVVTALIALGVIAALIGVIKGIVSGIADF